MINLEQAEKILKVTNPNNFYVDGLGGRYFDTYYLNSIDKYGRPYCKFSFRKYNNNLIIVCETFYDDIFIIGSKRIIKNIINKYNFDNKHINIYSSLYNRSNNSKFYPFKETDIMAFGYLKDVYVDKRFIDFLENELKDLNDSEKLFIYMED